MEYAEMPELDDKLMELFDTKDRERARQILEALKGLKIWQAEGLLKECGEFLHLLVIR